MNKNTAATTTTPLKYSVGEKVSKQALTAYYGKYWQDLFYGKTEDIEGTKSVMVMKALPMINAYKVSETDYYTDSVYGLLTDAFAEIEGLAEEMGEWYDNMPENLQDSYKANEVQEIQDELQQVDRPNLPDELKAITLCYYPLDGNSRPARLANIINTIEKCGEKIKDTCPDLTAEIEDVVGDLESISFPSMM